MLWAIKRLSLSAAVLVTLLLTSGDARAEVDPQVSQLVEKWLAAQNRNDLAAYQALYAADFVGIKNVSGQTLRVDRATWLRERAKVFSEAQHVAVQDLKAAPVLSGWSLTFTQVYESKNYKNIGSKQLELKSSDTGLLINREELVTSLRVLPVGDGDPTPVGLGSRPQRDRIYWAFVEHHKVILARDMARYAQGSERQEDYDGRQTTGHASGRVTLRDPSAALPARFRSLTGTPLHLHGSVPNTCMAKVGKLALMTLYPYSGGLGGPEPPVNPEVLLVADLDAPSAECRTAVLFARAADLPPLNLVKAENLDGAAVTKVKRAFKLTQTYKDAAQRESERIRDGTKIIAVAGEILSLNPTSWFATMNLSGDDCRVGELAGWALWQGGAGGAAVRRLWEASGELDHLAVAADVDGDGQLEVLTERGQVVGAGYQRWLPSMQVIWPSGLGCH